MAKQGVQGGLGGFQLGRGLDLATIAPKRESGYRRGLGRHRLLLVHGMSFFFAEVIASICSSFYPSGLDNIDSTSFCSSYLYHSVALELKSRRCFLCGRFSTNQKRHRCRKDLGAVCTWSQHRLWKCLLHWTRCTTRASPTRQGGPEGSRGPVSPSRVTKSHQDAGKPWKQMETEWLEKKV